MTRCLQFNPDLLPRVIDQIPLRLPPFLSLDLSPGLESCFCGLAEFSVLGQAADPAIAPVVFLLKFFYTSRAGFTFGSLGRTVPVIARSPILAVKWF